MWNWVGRIGIIGGLIGGAIGIVTAIIVEPVLGIIVGVIVIGTFYWVFKSVLGPEVEARRIIETGEPAEAVILKVTETGWTVNDIYYVVKFRLEVHRKDQPPYQAETKGMISRLTMAQFQAGMKVPVKVDPKNPQRVALVEQTEVAPSQAALNPQQVEEIKKKLEEKDKIFEAIRANGQSAPATVLRSWDMGIMVNGENPLMGFMLEVHPVNAPVFTAETQGVIMTQAVPKYQPGQTIYVKFDPKDTTRVAIDHS
jgi:prepilin signal peptidase PulO-like enzyme (type II secretory pathway)